MRSLRLPLEVGISSVTGFATSAVLIPFGLALMVAPVVAAIALRTFDQAFGYVFVGGVTLFGWGWRRLMRGWRVRPTDIVIEADGLRIDGGHNHDFSLAWSDVGDCKLVDITGKDEGSRVFELRFDELSVAEADDEDEIESLREVAALIRARVGQAKRREHHQAPRTNKKPEVFACNQCGAPLTPTADDFTTCTRCNQRTAMPTDVRDRVRAAMSLPAAERRVERLVTHLLDQPGARSTTILLMLSLALIGSAWPVTVWAYAHAYRVHQLTVGLGFALAALPFLLVLDGFFLSRLRMVDRRALASLATGFGARPPTNPGEPPRCRSCLAPLPHATNTVVRCVYCEASNITGIDLRALAHRTDESQDSLEDALRKRNGQRWTWRLWTLASLPLFVATGLIVQKVYAARGVSGVGHAVIEDLRIEGSHPQPSPDGKTLLIRGADGLWQLVDTQTRDVKTAPTGRGATAVAWAPDGRFMIATHTATREGIVHRYESGKEIEVATGIEMTIDELVLSPLGDLAVVAGGQVMTVPAKTKKHVWLMDMASVPGVDAGFMADGTLVTTSDFVALAHGTAGADRSFSFSPDRGRIVFVSTRTGGHDVFQMTASGGDIRALTEHCTDCADPAWSADGYVYFVSGKSIQRLHPGN